VLHPTLEELSAGLKQLNRQELLAQQRNSVHLIEGTGHVAMSKAPEVVPQIIAWLAGPFAQER
jgi:esterase FrsA